MENETENETIFEEPSRAPYSVRPHLLVNGTESEERVRRLCTEIDLDVEECKTITDVKYENVSLTLNCDFHPAIDGKLCREYVLLIFSVSDSS